MGVFITGFIIGGLLGFAICCIALASEVRGG